MKKIFKTLVAASVLLSGFVFTGCEFFIQMSLKNTEGKWYKYGGEVPAIPIGAPGDTNEDTQTGSLENAELYFYFENGEGLKVAIQAETTQNVELFGGAVQTEMKLVTGSVHTYDDFSAKKWVALTKLGTFAECDAPKVVTNPDECLLIGGEEANDMQIQWKKVLANIILSKLLGE